MTIIISFISGIMLTIIVIVGYILFSDWWIN